MTESEIKESNYHLRVVWQLYARKSPAGETFDQDGMSFANANQPWFFMNVGLLNRPVYGEFDLEQRAAQMFLYEGDAVVFRGANGPWKTSDFEFHFQPKEAQSLIAKVLETFKSKHGAPPKQFFIHGRTTFNDDEWKAFKKAMPKGTNLVGVRIKETHGESKLFHDRDYPVMRGTAIILNNRNALLWTNGFVPRLDSYIGPETPNPLSITVLRSTGRRPNIRTVLADIMGLTKINYNACNYNDGLAVTKVGDVLTMGSAREADKQPLNFYV